MTIQRLRVDFGDVVLADQLSAYCGPDVPAGTPAILYDGDGNSCLGTITDLTGDGFCNVAPAWEFWIAGDPTMDAPTRAEPQGLFVAFHLVVNEPATVSRDRSPQPFLYKLSAHAGVSA